jgi:hypothetical protein
LSAAVPGAGQFYNGSRIKPLFFLGAEIVAWGLHFKWQGEGNDATDLFEAFNREHWSREAYSTYLLYVYGVMSDSSLGTSHHLPGTDTQQYFEMTGKYNQFAWGWDDATYNDSTLDMYAPPADPPPKIASDGTTPYSANRFIYEDMRFDANNNYDRARKMIIVSILNRLVSSFEAYFAARRHNENAGREGSAFGGLSVRASLKTYHAKRDTPFVRLAYKF